MLPDGTLHADDGHSPVRLAMPDIVSPLRTVTLTLRAEAAGAYAADPLSRWLTMRMTDSQFAPNRALRISPSP